MMCIHVWHSCHWRSRDRRLPGDYLPTILGELLCSRFSKRLFQKIRWRTIKENNWPGLPHIHTYLYILAHTLKWPHVSTHFPDTKQNKTRKGWRNVRVDQRTFHIHLMPERGHRVHGEAGTNSRKKAVHWPLPVCHGTCACTHTIICTHKNTHAHTH